MTAEEKSSSVDFRNQEIDDLLSRLTLEEKVSMMSGSGFYKLHSEAKEWGAQPYPAGGANAYLGIEGLKFSDGPRGVIVGHSTCFPCSMARGATFDRDLEHRVGEAMAIEARAQGVNLLGQVCINLLRHPGWGRAQETYGEDSFHLGEMGSSLSKGTQHHNVISTVKHFALNSLENSRFELDVRIDERALREVYLPHFRKVIEAGCLSVMSAYNKVNGIQCGQNAYLLTDILRTEWGFEGFVHSDWVLGVYSPQGAEAGLDVENPEPVWFGDNLLAEVKSGRIDARVVDIAVARILRTLQAILNAEDPLPDYPMSMVAGEAHVNLAREVAEKSAVLLKNENVLPLSPEAMRSVGIFGKLAALENTGDQGSSRVSAPHVTTPLQGLVQYLGEDIVSFAGDESAPEHAGKSAAEFDAAIVVVGYTAVEEGEYIPNEINLGQEELPERLSAILDGTRARRPGRPIGGDRDMLSLPANQIELIKQVAAANTRTIVVLVAGSAVMVEEWVEDAPALLQTFYAGMEGGSALAKLLFGDVSPAGRLPFTVARDASHYPPFDPEARSIEYGYWHGYALLDRAGSTPRYPFGYGLSYSKFEHSGLEVERTSGGGVIAHVRVTNIGPFKAVDTPQLYSEWPGLSIERPRKNLRGFARIELAPGESGEVQFSIEPRDLAWYDDAGKTWKIESGRHVFHLASSYGAEDALTFELDFEQEIDLGK